ncbi:MAG TPA: PaaI family thioesterase [Acidimicrobiales bacterium]|nr:PaaI family thioesterase [Acidimicrobiales bacterium]
MIEPDPDLTATLSSMMPLMAHMGAEAVSADRDLVVLRLGWSPERCTSGGMLHGGALMTLADGAAGWCAFLNLPADAAGTTTIESKTNFLRGVRDGHVDALSAILHRGRTTIVVDTELRDAEERLVARVTQTQAVLMSRP